MDESDKYCIGMFLFGMIVSITIMILGLFKEEIDGFFDYHFTKEFLRYVLEWFVLTAGLTCIILGIIFLLYIKLKEK